MTLLKNFFTHSSSGIYLGQEYLYTTGHIIFLILAIPSIFALIYVYRNKSEDDLKKFIKYSWILLTITEVIKVSLNGFLNPDGFYFATAIPLYPCSLFMVVAPVAIYTKNEKLKHTLYAFLATFLLFGGLSNFFLADVLREYPVGNFFALHTLIYHYVIFVIGVLLWTTKVYKPNKNDHIKVFKALVLITIPIFILDKVMYEQGFNYFWFNDGGTTPLNLVSNIITNHWLWAFVMYAMYYVLIYLFYVPMNITQFFKKEQMSS